MKPAPVVYGPFKRAAVWRRMVARLGHWLIDLANRGHE
jgi:hypothetical protein